MNQKLELTQEDFDKAVQEKVEATLSSREEAQARKDAQDALAEAKDTFEQLRAAIEAKDAKIAEYEETFAKLDNLSPSEAEVAANERVVELEALVENLKHRAEVAEAALDTLAREETAASRMAELEEAGVALEGEDEAERQYAKVRDLDDENFESYKSELIALRSKYASASEEEGDEPEVAELSDQEIQLIAQSLGCDPQDSKCVSMVREVAEKMAEVTRSRKAAAKSDEGEGEEGDEGDDASAKAGDDSQPPQKETASQRTLSLGEAISMSQDQKIATNHDLKSEIAQEWESRYAERRGDKKSE